MPYTILVVEDETAMREIITSYLQKSGFAVIEAEDGLAGLAVLKTQQLDLMILDIMIPHLDGFTLCRYARESSMLPIIMLTARSDEDDKLRGFELGADDYITKPFSPKVLVAKVKALLKRTVHPGDIQELKGGEIHLNTITHTVVVSGNRVELTNKEYQLLRTLMANQGKVFSREELLSTIWGYDYAGDTRTIDTHIKRLRAKLGDEARHIITLIRAGYKFEVKKWTCSPK